MTDKQQTTENEKQPFAVKQVKVSNKYFDKNGDPVVIYVGNTRKARGVKVRSLNTDKRYW